MGCIWTAVWHDLGLKQDPVSSGTPSTGKPSKVMGSTYCESHLHKADDSTQAPALVCDSHAGHLLQALSEVGCQLLHPLPYLVQAHTQSVLHCDAQPRLQPGCPLG